jgi:hypothetical protein
VDYALFIWLKYILDGAKFSQRKSTANSAVSGNGLRENQGQNRNRGNPVTSVAQVVSYPESEREMRQSETIDEKDWLGTAQSAVNAVGTGLA